MKKGVFIFIGVILLLIIILATCSNSNDSANKLYSEAVTLVTEAKKIEAENVNEALDKYVEAFRKVETILQENEKSKIAAEIQAGEKKIGDFTFTQLKEQILPTIEQKANATKDLNSLLLFLLEKTEDSTYSKPYTLYEISKAHRMSNNLTEARQHLTNMESSINLIPEDKKHLKASLLLMMAVEYYQLRDIEKAKLHINNASLLAQNVKHTKLKERLLLSTISAYAEISQFAKAKRLVHKITDEYLQDAAYFDITDNFAQFQQIDSAFETAKQILAPDLKSRAYTNISKQLILMGRENTAEKYLEYCQDMLLDSIQTPSKMAKARIEIAHCYNILGKNRDVEKLVKKIRKDIQQVDNYHKSNPLKIAYAILLHDMKKFSESEGKLEETLILAESFPQNSSLALAQVAIAFAKVSQFQRAFQTAQMIKDEKHKIETLVRVTSLQMTANERISQKTAMEIQKIIQM